MTFLHRIIPDFDRQHAVFCELAPSGYTIAINFRNVTPEFYFTNLPDEWVEEYTGKSYALLDPVIQFTAFFQGTKRWSEITSLKLPVINHHIYERAKCYNLDFGVAIVKRSRTGGRRKHLLSLARGDRELTNEEIVLAGATFEHILSELQPDDHISERQIKVLALFSEGLTRDDVGKRLFISGDTVKKDMEKVRTVLGAGNATEAVAMAVARQLIAPYGSPKW